MISANKGHQKQFYKIVGEHLGARLKKRGWSINQVARKEGIQYNTVEAIISGRPFQFYQMIWVSDYLGCSVEKLISKVTTQIMREGLNNGKEIEEKRIVKKEEIKSGASSFI